MYIDSIKIIKINMVIKVITFFINELLIYY